MTALSARKFFAASLYFTLLLSGLVAAQQQPGDPADHWLNGKWRGPAPGGGFIVVDIKVVDDGEITGTAEMTTRSSYQPGVSGKVQGDKVTIILTNPRSGNVARFDLTRSGEQLSGNRKGEVVVFEKTQ